MKKYRIIETVNNGVRIKVTRFGNGKKNMLILPGVSLRPVSESAEAITYQYKKAWEDYTVWVFDRKEDMKEGYSVNDMAEDTAAAMLSLGIKDAYALGVSQGGMILQLLMINYPELIKKGVVASSASRLEEKDKTVLKRWISIARTHDVKALNHDCFMSIYSPEFIEKYKDGLYFAESVGAESECDDFAVQCTACLDYSSYDELEKIKCPVFVVCSAEDKIFSTACSEDMAKKLGCDLYVYERFAHAVYDEAPDFLDRILEFFSRKEE